MNHSIRVSFAAAFMFVIGVMPAGSQDLSRTARAFVPSVRMLGMGNAGVALAAPDAVFVYNPAQIAAVTTSRPRISLVGLRGSISANVFRQIT